MYQKFGVSEYWVVNPDTTETFGFILKDGKYNDAGSFIGKISSVLLNSEFAF